MAGQLSLEWVKCNFALKALQHGATSTTRHDDDDDGDGLEFHAKVLELYASHISSASET